MSYRNWCFTSPVEVDLKNDLIQYACVGHEFGESGYEHWQGYMELTKAARLSQVKKIIGEKTHLEPRKGTQDQAIEYCKKDGEFLEFGERKAQGKRNDITAVKEVLQNGGGMREVIRESNSYQAMRCAELILKYEERRRNWKPTVTWLWGSTGTGKTRRAWEEAGEDAWCSGKNGQWWQGYDAHENIILDDFRASWCSYEELLRILDRYPYTIECKGGSRQLLAKNIWITSPYPPEKCFSNDEAKDQLLRRIDVVAEVLSQKSGVTLIPD